MFSFWWWLVVKEFQSTSSERWCFYFWLFRRLFVGTDLSKSCRWIQARTSPREYCLLRNYRLKNPLTEAARIIKKGTKWKRTVGNSDDHDNNNYNGLHPGLLPLILERKYCETSSRENTIQEAKATSVYYVQLFLCQLCYDTVPRQQWR